MLENMSSTFTCLTCSVLFKVPDGQREHYKSDWHRYNLKRKVAELPPVTAEEFTQRVFRQRNIDAENEKDKTVYCATCHKTFSGANSYANHLNSKKHKEKLENPTEPRKIPPTVGKEVEPVKNVEEEESDEEIETDSEVEELSSDEWNAEDESNPINKNNCLFCAHHSRSLLVNLRHMTEAHSFFVPDVEYCVDLKGLLLYLGAKIFHGYMCLWCNEKGKAFQTASAAQKHMVISHFQIFFKRLM